MRTRPAEQTDSVLTASNVVRYTAGQKDNIYTFQHVRYTAGQKENIYTFHVKYTVGHKNSKYINRYTAKNAQYIAEQKINI